MRIRSRLRIAFIALAGAAILACGLFVLACRTTFFQNEMRSRIVAALERSTGARVELRGFNLEWSTLTARLNGLVIHGAEASGEPPLLSVQSLAIRLQISSFVRRVLSIVSLDAEQPEIYLTFRPDGSSNLPSAKHSSDWLRELLDLRVQRFTALHGTLEVNQQKHRFDLAGRDLYFAAHYDAAQPAYRLSLASAQTVLHADCCKAITGSVSSEATLRRDSLDIDHFRWMENRSYLNAQGVLAHFTQPTATFRFQASLDGQDLRNELPLDAVSVEKVTADGAGEADVPNGLRFEGTLSARRLGFGSSNVTIRNAEASSSFEYRKDELHFSNLLVSGLGGVFRGRAKLSHARGFTLDGATSQIELSQIVASAHHVALPWNARLSGPLSLQTALPATYRQLAFHSALKIDAATVANSLTGELNASKVKDQALQFEDSYLALPDSRFSFRGSWNSGITVNLATSNARGLEPITASLPSRQLRGVLDSAALVRFSGAITGSYHQPQIAGALAIDGFEARRQPWDRLRASGSANAQALNITSSRLESKTSSVSFNGLLGLSSWAITRSSTVHFHAAFRRVPLAALPIPSSAITGGLASGNLRMAGTFDNPSANGHLTLDTPVIYNQQFTLVQADLELADHSLKATNGKLLGTQHGTASFSGLLTHVNDWKNGELSLAVETAAYPVATLHAIHNRYPDLLGALDAHANVRVDLREHGIRPLLADGSLTLHDIALSNVPLGQIAARFSTGADRLHLALNGNLQGSDLSGDATVALTPGSPLQGNVRFERASLKPILSLLLSDNQSRLAIGGFASGAANISGSLENLSALSSEITLRQFSLNANQTQAHLQIHNTAPVLLKTANGSIDIDSCKLAGPDTNLTFSGSARYLQPRSLKLAVAGSSNLELLTLFDPNLESHGQSSIDATLNGPLAAPLVKGNMQIRNASLSLRDLSATALTGVNGSILFDNGRATVNQLSGQVGGGEARVGGFVSFGPGGTLIYHLNAQTQNVRVRSASNISVTADSNLRFTGTNASSLLAGTATISRVVFNPTTDVGNLLASFSAPSPVPANQKSFFSGLHLDVGIESAPSLQLNTALSRDVEAEVDLHLRGTPDRPVLLGSVSANEGDIRIFGSRYTINRGEVRFINASKVDPVLDLDLQTQARGIQVDITVAGTLNHLNVTYRSDPPLQPRDIIALLTVGRTPQEAANTQTTQIGSDSTPLQSGANTVLGQVVAQPPSRLSKLFGITNIKIDPLVQGITNTPQARLTLEQQISRAITVTYVTNLSQTSEQIFRLEWSLNPQFSVVAVRDDNGEFGLDFQYKKRFK